MAQNAQRNDLLSLVWKNVLILISWVEQEGRKKGEYPQTFVYIHIQH